MWRITKPQKIIIYIMVIAVFVFISLYVEKKEKLFTTQEINVSRGYHDDLKGKILFNKATYVQISMFKMLDKVWLTNNTGAILNALD